MDFISNDELLLSKRKLDVRGSIYVLGNQNEGSFIEYYLSLFIKHPLKTHPAFMIDYSTWYAYGMHILHDFIGIY